MGYFSIYPNTFTQSDVQGNWISIAWFLISLLIYVLSVLIVLVESSNFGVVCEAHSKLQSQWPLPSLGQTDFPNGWWKSSFHEQVSFCFQFRHRIDPHVCSAKMLIPCLIVDLGHFYFICAVRLWIILSVIILIKQFDFHQFNSIILGHFPCGHHYFNVLTLRHSSIMSEILCSSKLCTERWYTCYRARVLGPSNSRNKAGPKFKGTGKALLGQRL